MNVSLYDALVDLPPDAILRGVTPEGVAGIAWCAPHAPGHQTE